MPKSTSCRCLQDEMLSARNQRLMAMAETFRASAIWALFKLALRNQINSLSCRVNSSYVIAVFIVTAYPSTL